MSLSFVSKTIQTGRDDGGFDEKPSEAAENAKGKQSSYTSAHKPLFEQLREKKEQEEAERAEFQRSVMRGTLALDEEDAAHLDNIQKQRLQEEATRREQTEKELAAFRAAQAERLETQTNIHDESIDVEQNQKPASQKPVPVVERRAAPVAPAKIIVKKRKLRATDQGDASKQSSCDQVSEKYSEKKEQLSSDVDAKSAEFAADRGLGGLLSGYGSSDDDDDE